MPENTELDRRPSDSQVREAAKNNPPWTTVAQKGIGFTVSTITLFAILELTVLQFVPSRLASTELTVAVIVSAVLLSCAGSILYSHCKSQIRRRSTSAVALVLAATVAVMVVVVVIGWQRPTLGTDGGPLASLPLALAEQELNSSQLDSRLAGIAELKLVTRTQPTRQPVVIGIICSFIVKHSPASTSPSGNDPPVTQDIQAALNVLAHRNPAHDGGEVIDLDNANLTDADLAGADLADASLSGSNGADLTSANLTDADLSGADLANAYLGGADLTGTDLSDADLTAASFYQTPLCSVDNKVIYPARNYNCSQ